MLSFGVMLYSLMLWAGILFGAHLSDSPLLLLGLLLVTLILLIPVARPFVKVFLRRILPRAPGKNEPTATVSPRVSATEPGAPAQPRAPTRAFTLA